MKAILTFIAFFFCANYIFSTTVGTVKGIVSDDITSLPIEGATIIVDGFKAITNAKGAFEIPQIPVGKYNIMTDKTGYLSQATPLSIEPNRTENIRISLKFNTLTLPEALIKADRAKSAASSVVLNALDFKLRPLNSAQDMLRNVAGLFTAQHAGGGKAEQIFLRGFDCDHGTDVAGFVDGIPVNMPTHGHGQGYLDLHFLLPEVVKNVEVYKGTYFAELGDFATAGAIKFKTVDRLEKNFVEVAVGSVPSKRSFANSRVVAGYQLPFLPQNKISSYIASEYIYSPSYFDISQNFKRFNLTSKTIFELNEKSNLKLLLTHFNSSWDASGQVPERGVESGLINRFGSIDNTEGGQTERQNMSLSYAYLNQNQSFESQFYVSKYKFNLYSNFTFFKDDSINGDQINQQDDRWIYGFNTKYVLNSDKNKLTLGGGFRFDDVENKLDHTLARNYLNGISHAHAREAATNVYVKDEYEILPKLTAELGVRFNYYNFDVQDLIASDSIYENYSNKNYQTQLAPKFNLTYSFSKDYKLFLNAGKGFHSNDARAVVQDKSTNHQLPTAWGGEIGLQIRPLSNLMFSAAFWGLELENELVFVGDDGTTENNGASRRIGIDLGVRASLKDWLFFDADLNLAKGRLLLQSFGEAMPNNYHIALAPTLTSTGGLTVRLPCGIEGSFRYRHISDRPANEDNSTIALGYTVADLSCFYKKSNYRVGFNIENLFNVKWNEAQFDTESRLKNETETVKELHFTPGTPFMAKAIFSVYF